MIKHFLPIIFVMTSVIMLASCLGNDDDETIYYDDTAITAFTLGTLNVNHTTKASDGVTDSIYTTTLTGSDYKFNIDQLTSTIYNTDSLPYGTDVAHVLTTITSKNSGIVVFNFKDQSGADSLAYYSSSDSIDFTNPVRVRVYNMRGSAYREYTVMVNAHQEDGDSFGWKEIANPEQDMAKRKLVVRGDDVFLFGTINNNTIGYVKSGNVWQRLATQLGEDAYKNVVTFKGQLFVLDSGTLSQSTDGQTWDAVATVQHIKQLVGATSTRLYAFTDNGIAYSEDGINWTGDTLDSSYDLLPEADVNFISEVSVTNNNVNNLTLLGNRNGKTVVWSKVEENDNDNSTEPWAYYSYDEYNRKTLPYLENLQVVSYDNKLLATGGDLTKFYESQDKGLTWEATTTYALPEAYAETSVPFALCNDNSNILYFSEFGSSNMLTGRLARLGWEKRETLFTE